MTTSEITPRGRVDDFLAQRRFAMIGVSRDPRDFSRSLFRDFLARGYQVIPVHPECDAMEGLPCAKSIAAVTPPVEGVLLMTQPAVTESLSVDCAAAGVKRIWMYRATGAGSVSSRAVAFCKSRGIDVVAGECPYMFLPDTPWVHRLHGFVKRISGTYPR